MVINTTKFLQSSESSVALLMDFNHHSILIVEDDADIRSSLIELLEGEDYQVAAVDDGAEALSYFNHNASPEIILLDLSLPNMSGSEVMKVINQREDRHQIKVIVASGWSDLDKKSVEMKADGFIKKPYDIDFLLQKIKSSVNLH